MLHFKDAPARVWQVGMMNGQKLMRFGIPELVEGNGCISRLPEIIDEDGIRRVMIVAGKTVSRNGMCSREALNTLWLILKNLLHPIQTQD
jgi:Alcohol dehydrogenase, class IV